MSESIALYLNEIGAVALLDADSERDLAQIVERGVAARKRLDAGDRSREVRKAVRDGLEAKEQFVR